MWCIWVKSCAAVFLRFTSYSFVQTLAVGCNLCNHNAPRHRQTDRQNLHVGGNVICSPYNNVFA